MGSRFILRVPQFTEIPSYGLLDFQITKQISKLDLAKIRASNILNNEVIQIYGGPFIGRMAYLSFSSILRTNTNFTNIIKIYLSLCKLDINLLLNLTYEKITFNFLFIFTLLFTTSRSSDKMLDPVFPSVDTTNNIVYGVNYTVMVPGYVLPTGAVIPELFNSVT